MPAPHPEVVKVTSLVAALSKLNIGIPVEDVLDAVRLEDEAARARETGVALSKPAPTPMMLVRRSPSRPRMPEEHRRRVLALMQEMEPIGKLESPSTPRGDM